MLRLRIAILSHLLSPACPAGSASPPFSLQRLRLLSATAPAPPNPVFAVEDYLVATCGLTRPQALKASAKLSDLKSPSNPDAVVAFLHGVGVSRPDVAALIAKYPRLLRADVDRTLAPRVAEVAGAGLSPPEIVRLIRAVPNFLNYRSIAMAPKVWFYLSVFGSSENFFRALRQSHFFLGANLERVAKPNVALLLQCGLVGSDAGGKLPIQAACLINTNPERLPEMIAYAEGLGVPRLSGMFVQALQAVAFHGSEEKIAAKVECLKKTFRWSAADADVAMFKAPKMIRLSDDLLRSKAKFLISEVGLEPVYIAYRPELICYSMERRLKPRYYVLKFLKANGLLDFDWNYSAMKVREEVFTKKFITRHEEAAPRLAEDFASACRGEVPANFRFA